MNTKTNRPANKRAARTGKGSTIGASILKGLEQAVAWTRGENENARVTLVHVPEVHVRKVRTQMGLSQGQFGDEVRFSTSHVAQLGTGPRAPGRADSGPARPHRQAPRGRRGRPTKGELSHHPT